MIRQSEKIMGSCSWEWTSRGTWSKLLLTAGAAMESDQLAKGLKTSEGGT